MLNLITLQNLVMSFPVKGAKSFDFGLKVFVETWGEVDLAPRATGSPPPSLERQKVLRRTKGLPETCIFWSEIWA